MSDTENIDLTYVEGRTDTKFWAIGAILAALYGVGSLIPVSGFIIGGGIAANISLTLLIAPLFGILLGPWRGGAFGLIGGLIAMALGGSGGLFLAIPFLFLSPGISGFLTGLCVTSEVKGKWIPGAGITAFYLWLIMALYLIINVQAWWFMVYYATALIVALVLQLTYITLDFEKIKANKIWFLIPFVLIGTVTDFSMMTMGAVYVFQIPAAIFGFIIFPAMLIERTAAIIVSLIIILAIIKAFPEIWVSKQ
ncbi:MAG: hypothetical protein ACW98Y_13250 [Candidatus Thorarchaeota archaeon]|jgi:hypothetical protein